jgi:hypothetical protein
LLGDKDYDFAGRRSLNFSLHAAAATCRSASCNALELSDHNSSTPKINSAGSRKAAAQATFAGAACLTGRSPPTSAYRDQSAFGAGIIC